QQVWEFSSSGLGLFVRFLFLDAGNRGLGKTPLISLLGVALDFRKRLVASDGRDLLRRASRFGQAASRGLSQTMRHAGTRQLCGAYGRSHVLPSPLVENGLPCAVNKSA